MGSDGSVYDGDWVNDEQHGVGTETWINGSMYEGEYVMGEKHG